jgi:hypothetical protein
MVEDTLEGAKATRYGHAARHLLECRGLEAGIGERDGVEPHEAFVARLRARHGRKTQGQRTRSAWISWAM